MGSKGEAMNKKILKELEIVRKRSKDGKLHAEEIVEFAKNKNTALHSKFEWDDTKAAQEYRIWEARQLIKIVVTIIPHTNVETSVYVSLKKDRMGEGGYRAMVEVLSNKELRKDLLHDALEDFEYWKRKYYLVTELIPIFQAAEEVTAKLKLSIEKKKVKKKGKKK